MKICFLGDGQHINTQSWIKYLADVLDHEVHLVTFGHVMSPSKKVRVYSLSEGRRLKTFLRYIIYILPLKKLIATISPNILIGYRISSYGFMAASVNFHPLVLAAQGQNISYNNSRVKAYFAQYAIRKADLIHSWGEHMTQKLQEFGAAPDRILTLPRGINTNLFVPAKERTSQSQCYNLITTRGLNPDYNFEQILNSLSVLKTSIRNFKYIIAGDGPYKTQLIQKVSALELEPYVDFAGKIRYEDLPKYLQTSDIYISMVVTDGVSSSLLEAMACGIFPIVNNNAANKLWIDDGVNGYLVRFGDHVELASKIEAAIKNIELRRKAEKINRVLVLEKASVDKNMRIFQNAWDKLVLSQSFVKSGKDQDHY